jgi:hypothetical protein
MLPPFHFAAYAFATYAGCRHAAAMPRHCRFYDKISSIAPPPVYSDSAAAIDAFARLPPPTPLPPFAASRCPPPPILRRRCDY